MKRSKCFNEMKVLKCKLENTTKKKNEKEKEKTQREGAKTVKLTEDINPEETKKDVDKGNHRSV